MKTQYLCIHGHFYQPPREDPSTGRIQAERDAAPFHDFNEKVLAECYGPNAEHGNFELMSFDIGPTLGIWIRQYHPQVLDRIAEADRRARAQHGHGNAIMQSYHHTILPLASERDRRTELRWGIRWFEHTFGRRPQGIWLPETAIDYPTLEACADEGLTFTILSPDQAATPVDPRVPYQVDLPSGRPFAVLFYEGGLSGTVSFDPVATHSAPEFLRRFVEPHLVNVPNDIVAPVVVIASDGEVYGHHHRFKDLFLQDLLQNRAPESGITPISGEHYLALQSPTQTTGIRAGSSWGCAHDLLRWRGHCPCTPGDGTWKARLRTAFDDLAEQIDAVTETNAPQGVDIWTLRDAYVDVVIGATTLEPWLADHGVSPAEAEAQVLSTLMEAQRYRLAMYASCAFYWEDLSRIEAGYGVRSGLYAASLIDRAFGTQLQTRFSERLAGIVGWKSNKSAAQLYATAR